MTRPSPPRALLVDADAGFVEALAAQPALKDVRLEQATGGVHALRLVRHCFHDVVVTSPRSPIPEDLALVEEMRLVRPGVKAIVLAPSALPEEIVAALRAHTFSCFTAPFDPAEIAEMIGRALQNPDWKD